VLLGLSELASSGGVADRLDQGTLEQLIRLREYYRVDVR
jgi:hypothetical protein